MAHSGLYHPGPSPRKTTLRVLHTVIASQKGSASIQQASFSHHIRPMKQRRTRSSIFMPCIGTRSRKCWGHFGLATWSSKSLLQSRSVRISCPAAELVALLRHFYSSKQRSNEQSKRISRQPLTELHRQNSKTMLKRVSRANKEPTCALLVMI